jgi:hypothetical protein
MSVEGSVHILAEVFRKFRDAAFRNAFPLRVNKPTSADFGKKGAQDFGAKTRP